MENDIKNKIALLNINIARIKIFINSYHVPFSSKFFSEMIEERQQYKKQINLLQKKLERFKKLERINKL